MAEHEHATDPPQMTPAHEQAETHRYVMHFPEHLPRKDDPHYAAFEAFRRHHRTGAVCYVGERVGTEHCAGTLELHHAVLEFATANAADPRALHRDFPEIAETATAEEIADWLENSPGEFRWLCVLPGVPVLMADGSERPIEDVRAGDYVITHDGTAQPVLKTSRKRYRGEVTRLGGALLTPTHRVLTDRGWLPAAEVLRQVGVLGSDVIRLRGVKDQVGPGVVGSVSVDVVDALAGVEAAADPLLHDPAVLHQPVPGVRVTAVVDEDADVALRRDVASGAVGVLTRRSVESREAALVGAVSSGASLPVSVPMEGRSTDVAAHEMTWVAAVAGRTANRAPLFSGYVHDLSIAHNHSFIAGGIAVHNCSFHHRGHGGAHTASHADWTAQLYVPGLIT
jgi:hypothetical protein